MPGAVAAAAEIVIVLDVAPLATEVGENDAVTPVGAPSRLRSMLLEKPPDRETVAVTLPFVPCVRLNDVGETLMPMAGVGFVPVVPLSSLPPHAAAAVATNTIANFFQRSKVRVYSCDDLTSPPGWVVLPRRVLHALHARTSKVYTSVFLV